MSDVNKDQRKAHHKEQAGDDCDRDQKPSDVKGSHRNYAHFLAPAALTRVMKTSQSLKAFCQNNPVPVLALRSSPNKTRIGTVANVATYWSVYTLA
jgi:hypothetical protein